VDDMLSVSCHLLFRMPLDEQFHLHPQRD
jgi:hypothetical protein